ncbi:protein translocase subunit SecF [soil metagenome]
MAKPIDKTFKTPAQAPQGHAHPEYRFDFIRIAPFMAALTLFLTAGALSLIFIKGFNYGIDFAGGTEMQVKFDKAVTAEDLRSALKEAGVRDPGVQSFGGENEFLLRIGTPDGENENVQNTRLTATILKVKETLKAKFGISEEGLRRVDTVGPQVGSDLKKNGMLAAFYSFLVILIYISIRFDYVYAPGAILCVLHDAVMILGIFSLLGREVNIQIIASVLTLIGYSMNDTIVTFDRIRETAPLHRDRSLAFIINKAINDMLGRTFLTAGATLLACVGLYFFGGGVIADIAFTLIVGIFIGTYSSIYVAAPAIMVMEKLAPSGGLPHTEMQRA